MRKTIIVLFIVFVLCASAFAEAIDLVLLLDTSASMSNSYRETSNYLTGPFLREFLSIGDTFHLISFSSSPKLEISRRIEGIGDIEAVIGRLFLMYPLDPQSDLAGALDYTEKYASSLPGGRPKKIILISDGDASNTQNLVSNSQGRFKNQGTELQYIQVPVTGNGPSSGKTQTQSGMTAQAVQQQAQEASQIQAQQQAQGTNQTQAQPQQDAQGAAQTQAQQQVQGTSQTQAQPQQDAQGATQTQAQQQNQGGTQTQTQQQEAQGAQQGSTAQTGASAVTQAETSGPVTQGQGTSQTGTQQTGSPGALSSFTLSTPLIIGLGIAALLVLGLIIFFITRNLHSSPNRVMAQMAVPANNKGASLMENYAEAQRSQARAPLEYRQPQKRPLPKDIAYDESAFINDGGPIMLNLFVEDQNTAIGRRNIHNVKAGTTLTIGGGKSDFVIFLVPVPPNLADMHFDGRNCTLTPRKPEYFPDLGSQQVPKCIGKTIRVISDKEYELHIRIERYEDPLLALNKLLNSISVPGPII
jgi:hypothetical protein